MSEENGKVTRTLGAWGPIGIFCLTVTMAAGVVVARLYSLESKVDEFSAAIWAKIGDIDIRVPGVEARTAAIEALQREQDKTLDDHASRIRQLETGRASVVRAYPPTSSRGLTINGLNGSP
jgi:hypothetical protein